MLTRLVIEYVNRSDECRNDAATTCLVFLILALVFNVTAMGFCVSMYHDLRWKKYKAIGAEVLTRQMYLRYELFTAVRKLDMQFSLITLFTGLVYFVNVDNAVVDGAVGANASLALLELAWEWVGERAVRKEDRCCMWVFWLLSLALPSFIIGVAVDSYTTNILLPLAQGSVRDTIAVMAALALVNRVGTVVCSIVLYRRFGADYRGLRRILEGDRVRQFKRGRVKKLVAAPTQTSAQGSPSPSGAIARAALPPGAPAAGAGGASVVANPMSSALWAASNPTGLRAEGAQPGPALLSPEFANNRRAAPQAGGAAGPDEEAGEQYGDDDEANEGEFDDENEEEVGGDIDGNGEIEMSTVRPGVRGTATGRGGEGPGRAVVMDWGGQRGR
jgi:hypothetical protein